MTACGHLGRSQWKSGSGRIATFPNVRFLGRIDGHWSEHWR